MILFFFGQSPFAHADFDCNTVTEIPVSECEALVSLYSYTDGDNWSNNNGWLISNTPCSWHGLSCSNGHVTWLSLGNNLLNGSLPAELAFLLNLQYLYLYSNQLTGSIPPELGDLTSLKYLWLDDNRLTGSIPPDLGDLPILQNLDLSSNQLTGNIPEEFGNLENLNWIHLNGNMIVGEIPTSLANLANLNYANIGFNALYTDDFDLSGFLDIVDPYWDETQTVAPSNVQTESVDDTSIRISWTPILFSGDDGGYRVFFSTTSGGPYNFFGITDNKSHSEMEMTGLNPDTTYYFIVQTRTEPHYSNQNTVDSESSKEVSATTGQCQCDLNQDGSCNGLDWLIFYPDWGRTNCNEPETETCECDLNSDGSCNGLDWLLFYPDWGRTDCLE
jgi:hypothetical protein